MGRNPVTDLRVILDALEEARSELGRDCDPRCEECIALRRFIAERYFAWRRVRQPAPPPPAPLE